MRVIADIETLNPFFCVTFTDYDSEKEVQFIIKDDVNHLPQIKQFLSKVTYLISFNGIHFDSTILFWVISQQNVTVAQIYKAAQCVIHQDERWDDFKPYSQYKWKAPWCNIDLFLYWSKGLRMSKKLSLKYFAVNLDMDIQEMPIHHSVKSLTLEDEQSILEYNKLDNAVTKKLAQTLRDQINLRFDNKKKYGLDMLSWDAPKIASEILLDAYCRKNWQQEEPYWEFKKNIRNTKHEKVRFRNGDYLPQINFKTKLFQDLFKEIQNSYNGFSKEFIFKKFNGVYIKISCGSGGIHSVNKNESYFTSESKVVKTSDVASMYPNFFLNYKSIRESLYDVLDIYSGKKDERMEAKRKVQSSKKIGEVPKSSDVNDDVTGKLILNAITGLLDSEYSWLYSQPQIMALRLTGQMCLLRAFEESNLNQIEVVSCNTDGQEVFLDKEDERKYLDVISTIEKEFDVEFEHEDYKSIYYKSVNDYIAIYQNPKKDPKTKGEFIYEKVLDGSNEFLIVPIAVKEYFLNNIPIEQTIRNHTNIFDFCAAKKIAKNYKVTFNGESVQQLNRFYVSNKGGYLYKSKYRELTKKEIEFEQMDEEEIKEDKKTKIGTKLHVMKGLQLTLLNRVNVPFPKDIKYQFYISKAQKIIDLFEVKQQNLFELDQLKLF